MLLTMNSVDFGDWIKSERDIREWSQSDLSRQSGLHRAVISKIESGTQPMPETLTALAHAFKISPITIFRKAGLLPEGGDQISFEDWQHLIAQLTEEEQDEMREIITLKIERRKKSEQAARAAKFRPEKT